MLIAFPNSKPLLEGTINSWFRVLLVWVSKHWAAGNASRVRACKLLEAIEFRIFRSHPVVAINVAIKVGFI